MNQLSYCLGIDIWHVLAANHNLGWNWLLVILTYFLRSSDTVQLGQRAIALKISWGWAERFFSPPPLPTKQEHFRDPHTYNQNYLFCLRAPWNWNFFFVSPLHHQVLPILNPSACCIFVGTPLLTHGRCILSISVKSNFGLNFLCSFCIFSVKIVQNLY